jgi:hypothetical protein
MSIYSHFGRRRPFGQSVSEAVSRKAHRDVLILH